LIKFQRNKPKENKMGNGEDVYDFVIIGSGFGGSVSAMRLSEKGYRVLVVEKGKRYQDQDLPDTSWNFRKYLWMPSLGCRGILKIILSRGYFVYHGIGVGGGSLVYAAVLMEPRDAFFEAPAWKEFGNWKQILKPHYQTARKMLGVSKNPRLWPADEALREVAGEFGYPETFRPTEVGIYFGEAGKEAPDPYFSGEGLPRIGCAHCGACIVGCRLDAKNTLEKNYLYFAEKYGAAILADTEVKEIIPLDGNHPSGARYQLICEPVVSKKNSNHRILASKVILSAGVLGTLSLLFHCRDESKTLPQLSQQLGKNVRTNSEAFLGAFNPKSMDDHSKGLSITSIFNVDSQTQVEPVRCPAGSSLLFWLLSSPIIEKTGNLLTRLWQTLLQIIIHPKEFIDAKFRPGLSRRGIAIMIMQTEDNQMRIKLGRNPFTFFKKSLIAEQDSNNSVPINIELGQQVARALAMKINGYASGSITAGLLNVPMTAHILGGCTFGRTADEGVIGTDCQVHHYPGLYVIDGSIVPANPGVNPSLSITALSEYAMSLVPEKGKSQ
jgi:cholesterol oxidase